MRFTNTIYAMINLLISVAHMATYGVQNEYSQIPLYYFIKITAYVLFGLHVIFLILAIYIKNSKYQRWISYTNLSAIFLNNVSLRIYLSIFVKVDYLVFNLIFILQQFYTQVWFFTNNLDFLDGFWIYLKITITTIIYFLGYIPIELIFRAVISGIIIMTTSFFSYFYVKEKRSPFYYNFQNEETIKWYQSIIENMNSGFVSIENSKIVCMNKTLLTHSLKIKRSLEKNNEGLLLSSICNLSSVKIEMREEQRILNEINLSTLENLFSDILFDKNIQHDTDKSNFEISKEYLKKHKLEEKEEKENFVFLGTKGLNYKHENSTTQYYEVFGRYRSHYKDDNFEFIFNDVSKTKESEEINAEIKYKTIFLSKVAHEFKNPLICVSELVEEVREDLHVFEGLNQLTVVNKNTNNINQTLSQIKSMCEFLLI